jgi:hypothetical protein
MSVTWSGPSRALQFHLDLFERVDMIQRFLDSHQDVPFHTSIMPVGMQQRQRLMTASTGMEGDSTAYRKDEPDKAWEQEAFSKAAHILLAERKALNEGETHYVSSNVMAAVVAASETMEPEALYETDLPCPSGLIVFETPWVHDDLHPKTGEIQSGLHMPVRAISWTVSNVKTESGFQLGVCYCLYADNESFQAIYLPSYKKVISGTEDLSDLLDTSEQLKVWLTDTSGWSFGTNWDDEKYGTLVAVTRRFLLSYWRWTWQRILVPVNHTPSRAERKWIRKIKGSEEDGYIKVLRLRREIEHERQKGDYVGIFDYQFVVRGHWRRQHYPKLGPAKIDGEFNHESHRLVWIEPFIKGNPDGPLVLGHNITVAVR